jgi:hypothetical protein
MRDEVTKQEQGNSKDRMECGWLFRDQTGTIKQKARWNEWENLGTRWGSNLDPSVSFRDVANAPGDATFFPL